MSTREHRWSRRQRNERERLTPEQLVAAFTEALDWRSQWRAELEPPRASAGNQATPRPARVRSEDEAKNRAEFAAAVARAEFKHFYWDERRDAEFQQAKDHRSKPLNSAQTKIGKS